MHIKFQLAPLTTLLSFTIVSTAAMGQGPKASEHEVPPAFVGSSLICSQTSPLPSYIRVPTPLVERTKLKARLAILLRDSLYDDAHGVVNIARENEIRKLANKLRSERE